MAQRNLLTIVQEILSETGGDEVNSIEDTEEAYSVARTVKLVYEDLYAQHNFPEHYELTQLTALGDTSRPTHMSIPSDVKRICFIKYNKETTTDTDLAFETIEWCEPSAFLDRSYSLNESETNVVETTDTSGVAFLIENDKFPEYWTTFDDKHVVFDSYDSSEESTVQASRSLAYVIKIPTFTLSDTFIPDLDSETFTILYNEAKGRYVWNEKQTVDQVAERNAKRGRVALQHNKHKYEGNKQNGKNNTIDYGRRH